MKRTAALMSLLLAACRTTPTQRDIQVDKPVPSPPPPAPAAIRSDVARIDSKADASWARSIKTDKGFRSVVAPAGAAVTLIWRIGPQRKVKNLPNDQDYPANYVQTVDLAFGGGDPATSISLGELSGYVDPFDLTSCRGRGFRLGPGGGWGFPAEPSIASAFAVGVTQGQSVFLLVRDGDALELLHAETSDGKCEDVKQGPLHACADQLYWRVAEIRLPHDATLYERVDDDGKPFDCLAEDYRGKLLPPP
jgi:hypothetical protein